jgi:GNAT superfamily N-acetyltransferase
VSLTPVPPGEVGAVVTRMVMRDRPSPEPLPPSPLRLERWEHVELEDYRQLFRHVGARWLWFSRLAMSDAVLRREMGEVHTVLDGAGAQVGMVEIERRGAELCRIRFLGLVPDLTGEGHGRWLIAAAVALAWQPGTREVDLFTCTLDHPAALPAYLRAGFAAAERSFESFRDPRLTGLLPRDCAPQIPLLT